MTMTSTDNTSNSSDRVSPSRSSARRSSLAGETFANLFGGNRRNSVSRSSIDASAANTNGTITTNGNVGAQPSPPSAYEGPITSAARRLSMTTFGSLATSPGGASGGGGGGGGGHNRRESSMSSSGINESAIEEDESGSPGEGPGLTQQTAFSRRMSTSARALRDIRTGSNAGVSAGGGSGPGGPGSPKEGFNWSDNLRTRAERTSSIAGGGSPSSSLPSFPNSGSLSSNGSGSHGRNRSIAGMESAGSIAPQQPSPQLSQQLGTVAEAQRPKERPRPDHFQERILKGDFYMD